MLDAIAELQHIPMGHHGSPHQYPVGKRSCLNVAVPLPVDTTDEVWDDTLCDLPSVRDQFLSYAELRDKARAGDSTIRSLLNLCCDKFGDKAIEQLKQNGCCSKGGYDLGAWLRRNGWDVAEVNSAAVYQRVSKTAVVAKKGTGKGS